MTPDQRDKLLLLEQKLLDVFFVEAEPDLWPIGDTKDGRGDRYWCKKNAIATLAIVQKIQSCVSWVDHLGGPRDDGPKPSDTASDPMEAELATVEQEAAQLLDQYSRKRDGKAKG